MNVYDSEQIAKLLKSLGYKITSSLEKADLIIVNTCAIREKAEQKVFSFLGRLSRLKIRKPDLILSVGGCVAQQEGSKMLQRIPFLDFVFGTHAISRLPGHIKRIESKKCRIVDVEMIEEIDESAFLIDTEEHRKVSSFVTIMQGCDNFCTYCVVPYVRGREMSRDPEKIVNEIRELVNCGVKEVTLLGQNVNSYGRKEGLCSFAELLSLVNGIDGLVRIRFTTSHPKDLSDDLIDAFYTLEKICHHIHLPVQSGSNSILKRMNRKYTRELYLEKVDKLRNVCPDIAITSDFIVGFPGETEDDFKQTLDLIKTVEFDGLFAFKYSDRPNTPASGFSNKISEREKKDRLMELLDLQEHFTKKRNELLVGSTELALVEGKSKKQSGKGAQIKPQHIQWTGRTSTNKIINFSRSGDCIACDDIFTGRMVNIKIEKALSHSLMGRPIEVEPTALISCA